MRLFACGESWERGGAGVSGGVRKLLLDPEQLVVLSNPLATSRSACLDLTCVGGNRKVGNEGVLGLAAAMRDDGLHSVLLSQRNCIHGLGEGPNSVYLHQNCIARGLVYAPLEPLGVCDVKIISDKLDLATKLRGDLGSTGPVILSKRVLDRDQWVGGKKLGVVGNHVLGTAL